MNHHRQWEEEVALRGQRVNGTMSVRAGLPRIHVPVTHSPNLKTSRFGPAMVSSTTAAVRRGEPGVESAPRLRLVEWDVRLLEFLCFLSAVQINTPRALLDDRVRSLCYFHRQPRGKPTTDRQTRYTPSPPFPFTYNAYQSPPSPLARRAP